MRTKMWRIVAAALLFPNLFSSTGTATGNKSTMCATPGQPITVNVYGQESDVKGEKGDPGTSCKCNLQDSSKPSAHLDGAISDYGTFSPGQDLNFWSPAAPHGHLTGGMTYRDGKLTVPTNGRYFIYAQAFFDNAGSPVKRISIRLNGNRIALTQPQNIGKIYSTGYTGGVFILRAGDIITVRVEYSNTQIYRGSQHSYFGAFLI